LVKSLDLAPCTFIVVGSGILAALELRDVGDVDVIVTPEIFQRFEDDPSWQRKYFDDGTYYLICGVFEVGLSWDSHDGSPNLADLKSNEHVVDEIPFVAPARLLTWKEKMSRPKDQADIQTLRDYLG